MKPFLNNYIDPSQGHYQYLQWNSDVQLKQISVLFSEISRMIDLMAGKGPETSTLTQIVLVKLSRIRVSALKIEHHGHHGHHGNHGHHNVCVLKSSVYKFLVRKSVYLFSRRKTIQIRVNFLLT